MPLLDGLLSPLLSRLNLTRETGQAPLGTDFNPGSDQQLWAKFDAPLAVAMKSSQYQDDSRLEIVVDCDRSHEQAVRGEIVASKGDVESGYNAAKNRYRFRVFVAKRHVYDIATNSGVVAIGLLQEYERSR